MTKYFGVGLKNYTSKSEARDLALAERSNLPDATRLESQIQICLKINQVLSEVCDRLQKELLNVAGYMPHNQEVDLAGLYSTSCHRFSFPRVYGDELKFYFGKQFKKGKFGILVPDDSGVFVEGSEIDVVLVPGVAFDQIGNRVGYGKGYYDRWLSGKSVAKIGIAFQAQVFQEFNDIESHDIPMDFVVTENYALGNLNGSWIKSKVS